MPLASGILKVPDQCLLFGVHEDHRLTTPLELFCTLRDVLELRITVGVLSPLARFAIGLKAVA